MNKLNVFLLCFFIALTARMQAVEQDNNYQWNNVKMGGGGFVSGIITSPGEKDLIYARTDVGGAYRWIENTQSWKPLLDWVPKSKWTYLGVESMAVDPQAPNKLYILAGLYTNSPSSVLRSDDYGESFKETTLTFQVNGNGMGRQNGERLAVDPNQGQILFCGSRSAGLWKSVNGAVSWTNVPTFPVTTTPSGNGICFVLFDKSSGSKDVATQTIYVGCSQTGTNLFVSKDGGAKWNALPDTAITANMMPQRAVISPDGKFLYVTYSNGAGPGGTTSLPYNQGAVMKCDLSTNLWTNISPYNLLSGGGAFCSITMDASNANRLIATTINHWSNQQYWDNGTTAWGDRLFLTTNGGKSWIPLLDAQNRLILNRNGNTWIGGHNLHWVGSAEIDPFNPKRVFFTSGNGIFMTDNLASTGKGTLKFMVEGLEETVPLDMCSVPGGPFLSIIGDYDGFVHQDLTQSPALGRYSPTMGTSTSVTYCPQNNQVLARVGSSGAADAKKLYYSLNQGKTWRAFSSLPATGLNDGKIALASDGKGALFIPGNVSALYYTSDWGKSWSNLWTITTNIKGAHPYADPVDSSRFYIYCNSNGFMYVAAPDSNGTMVTTRALSVGASGSSTLAIAPDRRGDIWIARNANGLVHYQDSASKKSVITTMSYCQAVALGKAAPGKEYPTVYIWGIVDGVEGLFRSTDKAVTWVRVNDDQHQYGSLGNANMICADWNQYGRVFMSTAGRGIAYGSLQEDPNDVQTLQIDGSHSNDCVVGDQLDLSFSNLVKYRIFSLGGNMMDQGEVENLCMGSNYQKGMYLVQIKEKENIQTIRWIKKN